METNEYVGTTRRTERSGKQALVNRVDPQRIGVHQHQTEVGFVAADDRRLQALGGLGTVGVKRRQQLRAASAHLICRQSAEVDAVKTII